MSGNSDGIFGVSGDQLVVVDTTNLDFETTTGYALTISGSDGSFDDIAIVNITILDVNNNAPIIENTTGSLRENAVT
jgi:hypothetical protein